MAIIGIIMKASVSSLESSCFSKYPGAPHGHHVIFHAKGPLPAPSPIYIIVIYHILYIIVASSLGRTMPRHDDDSPSANLFPSFFLLPRWLSSSTPGLKLRSAETELRNAIEFCTNWSSKTGSRHISRKKKKDDFETRFIRNFKKKIISTKMKKICCQSTIRNFHAATRIQFTTLSCKTQQYYARNSSSEEPWRNHSTAICRDSVAKRNRITHKGSQGTHKLQLQNRISTHKQKNDDFEAKENHQHQNEKILPKHHSQLSCSHYNTIYDSQLEHTMSITHTAAAARNLGAAIPLRSAETELLNTMEIRTAATQIAAPKPDDWSRHTSRKTTILKHFLKGIWKGKSSASKWKKSAAKAPFATFMQPLQYNLRFSAAKPNSITHAAAAARNLDTTIPLRRAQAE